MVRWLSESFNKPFNKGNSGNLLDRMWTWCSYYNSRIHCGAFVFNNSHIHALTFHLPQLFSFSGTLSTFYSVCVDFHAASALSFYTRMLQCTIYKIAAISINTIYRVYAPLWGSSCVWQSNFVIKCFFFPSPNT